MEQELVDRERLRVIAELRTWKGTRWKHQGRLKGIGVDCIGLAMAAARSAGAMTPAMETGIPSNYGRYPHGGVFLRFMQENLELIPSVEDARAADLVMMCWNAYPMHIGVLTDYNGCGLVEGPFGLIHAMVELETVTEQRFDPSRLRVHSYYRFRNFV